MMNPYTRFDDPTMYSSWDMISDVNLNVDAHKHADTRGKPIDPLKFVEAN